MEKEQLKLFLLDYLKEQPYFKTNREGFFTCINPEHQDQHPSMSYDSKRNIIHCFACGKTYNLIDLVMLDRKLSYKDAIAWLNNKYDNQPLPSNFNKETIQKIKPLEEELSKLGNENFISYLCNKRGFKHSKEIVSIFNLKSDSTFLYIPHRNFINIGEENSILTFTDYQARYITPINNGGTKAQRYKHKGRVSLYDYFQLLSLPTSMNIVICEGEIDSLSIFDLRFDAKEELKGLGSIALSGVANTNLLRNKLEDIPEETRKDYHFLIALDNDRAGQDTTKIIEEMLTELGYPYSTMDLLKENKDINERLQKDRSGLLEDIKAYMSDFSNIENQEKNIFEKNKEEYLSHNTSKTHLNALLSDFTSKNDKVSINTNFEALNGLFYGVSKGVITLGALSSLGKTTLLLQLADQLASNNDTDILYFSLEQSGKELVSKSLSRFTFLNALDQLEDTSKAKYSNRILATKLDNNNEFEGYDLTERILLNKSIYQYDMLSNRLFIIEPKNTNSLTIKDIEEAIEKHISITGNKPIVFIDYLQIIAPEDKHLNDKQAVDINISNLRRICSIYDLLVFAISSVGRGSYNSSIEMDSYKESGAIEYGSDILLGLNFTRFEEEEIEKMLGNENKKAEVRKVIKEEKDKRPRNVYLEVLKNRNGKVGDKIYFHYYPEFNTFIELDQNGGREDRVSVLKPIKKAFELEEQDLPF